MNSKCFPKLSLHLHKFSNIVPKIFVRKSNTILIFKDKK